jgi:hypothetical protein
MVILCLLSLIFISNDVVLSVAGAVVNIYNSSTCSGIATTNKTYPTDQCLPNYQLNVQYQCGNDLSSIPLPFGYRYILYS